MLRDRHGAPEAPSDHTWLRTASGRAFRLVPPDPAQVSARDIADHLARINRFNGALNGGIGHYSVAQHSMLVARMLPAELKIYGLLHDAHEAYIGDRITPVKLALAAIGDRTRAQRAARVAERIAALGLGGNADPSVLFEAVEEAMADCDAAFEPFHSLADQLDIAILAAFRLPLPGAGAADEIKRADLRALATEQRDLMLEPHEVFGQWGEPHRDRVVPLAWHRALDAFALALGEALVMHPGSRLP